jgi:hypothetical protein
LIDDKTSIDAQDNAGRTPNWYGKIIRE